MPPFAPSYNWRKELKFWISPLLGKHMVYISSKLAVFEFLWGSSAPLCAPKGVENLEISLT